jgi:hypothetical protein
MYSNAKTTAGMLASLTTSINDMRNIWEARGQNGLGCINPYQSNESSGTDANRKSRKNTSHCTEGIKCGAVHIPDADPTCSVIRLSLQIVAHALSNRQSSIYPTQRKSNGRHFYRFRWNLDFQVGRGRLFHINLRNTHPITAYGPQPMVINCKIDPIQDA